MKKLPLILLVLICLNLFAACSKPGPNTDSKSEANSLESEESMEEPVKDYPVISGSFIQYEPFLNYTDKQLTKHFDYLQEAGIKYLVLYTSAFQNKDGAFTTVYYPSKLAEAKKSDEYDDSHADITERMLAQCQSHGIKAFLSPNYSPDGWANSYNILYTDTIGIPDADWHRRFSNDSVAIAEELYSLYKEKYGDAFYGWYFVPEFTNYCEGVTDVHIDKMAEMLNIYIDGINALDPSMPFLMSPYFVESYATPQETAAFFDKLFTKVHFRKGDIFCPQDCVGSGFLNAQTFMNYYKELKTVIDKYPNLSLWGNPESFKQANWSAAPVTRFVYQLQAAAPYVEGFISFAYSHYYAPDIRGTAVFHNDYVNYYKTGQVRYFSDSERIEPISFEVLNSATGVSLKASFQNCKYGVSYVEFYRDSELVATAHTDMKNYGDQTLTFTATDRGAASGQEYTYSVIAYDFILNKSEKQEAKLAVSAPECVSVGKPYATDYNGYQTYPDDGKKLTDGKFASTTEYYDPAASGFAGVSDVSFVIDLEETTQISAVVARALSSGSGGAIVSSFVEVSFSDDGQTFTGAVKVDATLAKIENGYSIVEIPVTGVAARYVKVSYLSLRNWLFIDEISVYRESNP